MAWAGEYSAGVAGWGEVLDEALRADDVDRTPHRLAEMCLANDPMLDRPAGEVVRSGLPRYQPGKVTVRRAASALLGWAADHPGRAEAPVWRVLGLLQLHRYQTLEEGSQQVVEDHQEALREAEEIADPDLVVLCLLRLATSTRNVLDSNSSLSYATRAVELLGSVGAGVSTPPAVLAAATGDAPWLLNQADMRAYLTYRAHARARIAARMLRDYERTIAEADLAIAAAEAIKDRWRVPFATALGERAAFARTLGDVTTALEMLRRLGEYAAVTPALGVQRAHLKTRYHSAQDFDDWAAARKERLELLRLRLSEVLDDAEPSPANAARGVELCRQGGRRAQVTKLGNDAYEFAFNLIHSGRAALDPAARAEARAWLDVAHLAWSDIATNGRVAVDFRRLHLDAMDAVAGDPAVVGRRMVELSRAWRRALGQRRAAITAVEWGAPGDEVILERLEELRAGAPAVDAAFLDLGIANWYLRAGDSHATDPAESGQAAIQWATARRLAGAAAAGLRVDQPSAPPVLLNPAAYIEALQVQAGAMRRLRDAGAPDTPSPVEELAIRIDSLPAVARRLTASVTPLQRATIDRLYSTWLAQTGELSVQLNDHRAADAVMEVARRDMVGTVLHALVSNPDVPEKIAALARQLIAVLNATITDTDTPDETSTPPKAGTPDETGATDAGEEPGTSPAPGVRGMRIMDQLNTELDVVGTVVGPVAKGLFDPHTVLGASTAATLDVLHPDGEPGVVLSLWLLPAVEGAKPRLMRRMAWRSEAGGQIQESLDLVPVPTWLAGYQVDDDPDLFFARLDMLTERLLPPPLLDLLHRADPDHPIGLTVIPTGLLAVPFAALSITSQHKLVDLAVLSTAQSLEAVDHLAAGAPADDQPLQPVEIGIYDDALTYAPMEWEELHTYYPKVQRAASLEEIDHYLSADNVRGCLGVFALAVHGSRGTDGWSQIKQMPSGQHLTTGHVLQWYIPRLVVGASCNTDIRSDAGGELGGFPLAFQLRGAATIIGTLHYVDDESTAQIMGLFYANCAAGLAPAAALRQAQRSWISAERATRLPQMERWAYLLTYGLPR